MINSEQLHLIMPFFLILLQNKL